MLAWVSKEDSGYVSRFRLLEGLREIDPGSKVELAPYGMSKLVFSPSEPGIRSRQGAIFHLTAVLT